MFFGKGKKKIYAQFSVQRITHYGLDWEPIMVQFFATVRGSPELVSIHQIVFTM